MTPITAYVSVHHRSALLLTSYQNADHQKQHFKHHYDICKIIEQVKDGPSGATYDSIREWVDYAEPYLYTAIIKGLMLEVSLANANEFVLDIWIIPRPSWAGPPTPLWVVVDARVTSSTIHFSPEECETMARRRTRAEEFHADSSTVVMLRIADLDSGFIFIHYLTMLRPFDLFPNDGQNTWFRHLTNANGSNSGTSLNAEISLTHVSDTLR